MLRRTDEPTVLSRGRIRLGALEFFTAVTVMGNLYDINVLLLSLNIKTAQVRGSVYHAIDSHRLIESIQQLLVVSFLMGVIFVEHLFGYGNDCSAFLADFYSPTTFFPVIIVYYIKTFILTYT